jgi:DNA-binding protein HU-beta
MTKIEIAHEMSEKTGLSIPDSKTAIDAFIEIVKKAIGDEKPIFIRGFGTFTAERRSKKIARDIRNNTAIDVPAHNVPHFKPSKEFKALLR